MQNFRQQPAHLMRLGVHAEQQFFIENTDSYDMVLFNANLAHYFSGGTASLIVGKLHDKPFIIDPITHAFGHNPRYIRAESDDGNEAPIKASLAGLAEEYGAPVTDVLGNRGVLPEDFSSKAKLSGFTERVLRFQEDGLANALDPSDAKYIGGNHAEILTPYAIIAPYFYMKRGDVQDWLPINIELIRASRSVIGDRALFAELVIDRGLLDTSDTLQEIAQSYQGIAECDGYFLWISDHSEHDSAMSTLRGLRELTATLAETGKPVVNLYAGYFSTMLINYGMSGICHGPGYGEDRDVIPVGGGMPTSKFYLTPVHQRMLFRDVQFMVAAGAWSNEEDFFENVCSGPTCTRVLGGGLRDNFYRFGEEVVSEGRDGRSYTFPTPQAKALTTNHYIEAKALEFEKATNSNPEELIAELIEARQKYERFLPGAQLRYLDYWAEALGD